MKGNITISRPSGRENGQRIDYVQISFEDESSSTRFLQAKMNYKNFALAVMGSGMVPCEFDLTADKVGLVYEHKREQVFMPGGDYATQEERAAEAIKPFEVDGWIGRARDALNHHNRLRLRRPGGSVYKVVFVRWVEKGEES